MPKKTSRLGRITFPPLRRGFTLIEVLIATGVIAVIAGVSIYALAPRKNFIAVRDAERYMNAKQIQNSMFQYMLESNQILSEKNILDGEENAKPICREGVPEEDCIAEGRVSLNDVPPEFIANLPIDPVEPCAELTGYKIYQTVGRPRVFSAYLGMLMDDEVEPDCELGGVGGSSSSSSTSSSSSSSSSTSISSSSTSSSSSASPPMCNGQAATIYVDGTNTIVGGPDDGLPYTGTLTGSNGDDVIVGTAGVDTIDGDSGDDIICAGAGDDNIVAGGGNGTDTIFGEEGDDVITGDNGKDTVCGGEGDDTIAGNNAQDELDGGPGTDSIDGGNAPDVCVNGESLDNCEDTETPVGECD